MSCPTATFVPIDKPTTHGVYYYGDSKTRATVQDEDGDLIVYDNEGRTRLADMYTQWYTPVLPPVRDCIDYVILAGWSFDGYERGTYLFRSLRKRASANTITFTLSELRDAFRNGF